MKNQPTIDTSDLNDPIHKQGIEDYKWIKSQGKMTYEKWLSTGKSLRAKRLTTPSNPQFGQWRRAAGYDMTKLECSSAIWLAEMVENNSQEWQDFGVRLTYTGRILGYPERIRRVRYAKHLRCSYNDFLKDRNSINDLYETDDDDSAAGRRKKKGHRNVSHDLFESTSCTADLVHMDFALIYAATSLR